MEDGKPERQREQDEWMWEEGGQMDDGRTCPTPSMSLMMPEVVSECTMDTCVIDGSVRKCCGARNDDRLSLAPKQSTCRPGHSPDTASNSHSHCQQ